VPARERPRGIAGFVAGLAVATALLVWLVWTATNEMHRSTSLLQERRASEVLALVSAAINRDMKGMWLSVLTPLDAAALQEDPPYDLRQLASRAFARFPYPDSLLVWTPGPGGGQTYAFTRTDRVVPWRPAEADTEAYPVTLLRDPPAVASLVTRLIDTGRHRRRFAVLETDIDGRPYQVVAHLIYASPEQGQVAAVAAFTVDLEWVSREYLSEILRQVATIDGQKDAMAIAVLDDQRQVVATSRESSTETPVRERTFPLLFFEPALVSSLPPPVPAIRQWTAQVRPAPGATSAISALRSRMLVLATLAGATALIAVLLTLRAVRVSTELATMKSDFVAAVTHELKTPVALIKLVGDTLERGRYTSADTVRDYAGILNQEARRLDHLIENLLTYSRLSDLRQAYRFEAVDVAELVDEALEPFRPPLKEQGFELVVDVAADLAPVHVDRAGIVRVFANIIDNAMKYSVKTPRLAVRAAAVSAGIAVVFEDRGAGIASAEIPHVFDKFYRVQRNSEFGSGLGLSIVRQIVQDHSGTVSIDSQVGEGTAVTVVLPAAARS